MLFSKQTNDKAQLFSASQKKTVLKIAICDDEPFMIEDLMKKAQAYFASKAVYVQIETFSCGESLVESELNFDLIFLDIRMREMDGIQAAKTLRKQEYQGFLIFVTALDEYVFDSFAVEAYDFLVKPLDHERFARTLDRVLETMRKRCEAVLLIQISGVCLAVPIAEIFYCEIINRKIYVYSCNRETIAYYDKIEDLEKRLGKEFFRCHRSYLVHLKYVCGYENGQAFLQNGVKIPVSRLRGQAFSQAMLQFMKM